VVQSEAGRHAKMVDRDDDFTNKRAFGEEQSQVISKRLEAGMKR
jgi:hypothetical protein